MPYFRHASSSPDHMTRNPAAAYGAPAGYHALRLAAPDPVSEQFADEQRPPRDCTRLLDVEQVGLAAAAVHAVLQDGLVEAATATGVRLFDPESMEEMAAALPGDAADAVEMLRRAPFFSRCGEVACNLHKVEKALRGTSLDICSSNESTIHPANGLLIQALRSFSGNTCMVLSAHHTNDHYSRMLHCWASKLEKDAGMVPQGEKGRKYMFLLNNMYDVLQMMRHPGASFHNGELVSRLNSLILRYKKNYLVDCWVPLNYTCLLNVDKFIAEFLAICDKQRIWKVTAELKYELREEIVDLIVPQYEVSLSALQANRSKLSGVLSSFKRVTQGKKKHKRYTGEELKKEIRALFEG